MRDLNYGGLRREPFRQGVETLPGQGRRAMSRNLGGWHLPKGIMPSCKLTQTTAQTLTSAGGWQTITMDVTAWDNSDPTMAVLASDHILIRHASIYLAVGALYFVSNAGGTARWVGITHNATRVVEHQFPFAGVAGASCSVLINCERGDTVKLQGLHDVAPNLATDVVGAGSFISVVAVAPPI